MLSSDVVKESDLGERFDIGIGGRGRLAIAKKCCNDDKILAGVKSMGLSYEPFVIGNCFKSFSKI
jgi:hypothetical protein